MKTLLSLLSLSLFIHNASSQLVDSNAFIKTNLVEVAVGGNGKYITDTVPEGYILLENPGTSYGFIADYDMNGWEVGEPPYSGDFCAPGSSIEEWGLSCNGINYRNGIVSDSVQGYIISYIANDDSISVVWISDSTELSIKQTTTAYADKLFFLTKFKLFNNSPDTLNNIYYVRSLDPDNEKNWTGDYMTENGVDADTNYSYAKGLEYGLFLGMVAGDPLARGTYGNFTIYDAYLYDPYLGTGGYFLSGSLVGDIAIQMSFYRPELAPGDSLEFIFAYVFSPDAIEEAYLATLNLDYGVDCLPDTTISASLITITTATINWTSNPGHFYDIIYTNLETGITDTVHSLVSPLTLNDLDTCTTYEVYMITDCNGEITASDVITFTTDCVVPIQEFSNNSLAIEIYPNPADDVINLILNSSMHSDLRIIVSDLMGKQLMSKTVKWNSSNYELSIPVNQLLAGVYHISVYNGNAFKIVKFIKS